LVIWQGIRWKADMATSIGDDPLPSLDRASTSPLYAQIREALRRQIDSHILPPGAPLPTEDELQIRYGVSRSVVRQALGELAQLGLIHRQRGRGSVVAPLDQHRRRASQAGGLRQQVAEAGQQLRTEVISLDRDNPPAAAQQALGTTDTWRLERVRYVDDAAVVFMRTWLPRDLFPEVPATVLDGGSLHDFMRTTGVKPSGGPRHLQAVPADDEVATRLGVRPGVPLVLLEGVTADAVGRGLEWFLAWHGPHTVFDVDASVEPSPPPVAPQEGELEHMRGLADEMRKLLERAGQEPQSR
jgi:GntR family transcriptional regulator